MIVIIIIIIIIIYLLLLLLVVVVLVLFSVYLWVVAAVMPTYLPRERVISNDQGSLEDTLPVLSQAPFLFVLFCSSLILTLIPSIIIVIFFEAILI